MKASGLVTCGMGSVNKNGLMVLFTMVNGKIIKQKEKENLYTQMEITMKENGKTIKLMATGCLCTLKQEQDMKDIGKMICNMDQALRFTVMEISMRGCSNKVGEMGKELTIILPEKYTKEAGSMAELKALEFAHGLIRKSMKDNGKIIRSMDKGSILGLMEEAMRVIIVAIRNMAMEFMFGQMVESTSENGRTTRGTGEEHMSSIVNYQNKVFGKKTKE
jgi:hypothetical protein